MATVEEKTERRWWVVKGILYYLAAYGSIVVAAFLFGFDVGELSALTNSLFGAGFATMMGHWFSAPRRDYRERDRDFDRHRGR